MKSTRMTKCCFYRDHHINAVCGTAADWVPNVMFYMALFLLLCLFAYVCIEWLNKHTAQILSSAYSRPSHDRFHKELSLLVERFNCVGSMSRRERFGLYWTHLHRVRELVLDILKGKFKKHESCWKEALMLSWTDILISTLDCVVAYSQIEDDIVFYINKM